jgi:hypothetical protein
MAKLSARGRTEVARFSKEEKVTDPSRSTDWERTTYALMSDGHLLKKWDVNFKSSNILPGGKHSYGWKDQGKKAHLTADKLREVLLAKGYTEEKVRA